MTDTPLTPVPDSTSPGARPSGSTVASVIGGALAAVLFRVLMHYGITLQAGDEAAAAGLFAALLGYLPKSGRQ